jgi:uridine kinase
MNHPSPPVHRPAPLVIGIAGGSGSGKTTVAQTLLQRVGADRIAYLQHDSYYKDLRGLPPAQRNQFNFDHPHSLETELLTEHIAALRAGQAVEVPIYDFSTDSRTTKTFTIQPRDVILVEGILIFTEPALREMFDIKIFVDTDADLRFIRRLERASGPAGSPGTAPRASRPGSRRPRRWWWARKALASRSA